MMMMRRRRGRWRSERPGAICEPLSGHIRKERHVIALCVTGCQWETRIACCHQIKHARIEVIIDEIVLATEGQCSVAVHPFLRRLRSMKSATRCRHTRMSSVTVIWQQNTSHINAFRCGTSFNAELKSFTSTFSSLLSNILRQSGWECEISTHLADH